jgi:flagellar FliJ protein
MAEIGQLAFLEKLEAGKSDAYAAQLAKARMASDAAEAQLEQLRRYESSYHGQLSGKLAAAVSIDTLRSHHRFMQNVAHAIRQQELEVARRLANTDAIERVWREIERRRQGFRVMAEKAARLAHRTEDQRQQKLNDEYATRIAQRSGADL